MYLYSNRWLLALPSIIMFVASALFVVFPSVAMDAVTPDNFFPRMWAGIFFICSGMSIYGILNPKKWFWEYISLILLMASFVIYAVAVFAYAGQVGPRYLAPSLLVLVPASMLLPRFLAIRKDIRNQQ